MQNLPTVHAKYGKIANLYEQKQYWEEKKIEFTKFIDWALQSHNEINIDFYTLREEIQPEMPGMLGMMTRDDTRTVTDKDVGFEVDEIDATHFLTAILSVIESKLQLIKRELEQC